MRRTPSTRQYALGMRKGKILFGRKCNPVFMKQEGTISFGRRKKDAPRPYSGMNCNKVRLMRDANKWQGRSSLQQREAFHKMLSFLVEREFKVIANHVTNASMCRQALRTRLLPEARRKIEAGYRIKRGELVFI